MSLYSPPCISPFKKKNTNNNLYRINTSTYAYKFISTYRNKKRKNCGKLSPLVIQKKMHTHTHMNKFIGKFHKFKFAK